MDIKRNTDSAKTAVNARSGFTLVEMVISILVLGFVLISVAGIFALFQKGSVQSGEYSLAQQNARIAVDFITGDLRQAGAQTDYYRGQRPIVHAGPYQIAFNADLDNGATIDGNPPLQALSNAVSPNSVPLSGAPIYTPAADYDSDAETVVFTLDSTGDGIISGSDRGDDPEETPLNRNLFVLKKAVYGYAVSGGNEMRENDLALLRGPNLSPTWTIPEPLFQYYYDHDDDPATNDRLWGDGNVNGRLDDAEILAVAAMPQNLLSTIRKVRITAISESDKYDSKYETNGGFLNVTMNSEVFVRNMSTSSSTIRGKVYHDADSDGVMDTNETGLPAVEIRLAGQNRSVFTDNFGSFYFALPAGAYSIQEVDPPGYSSTTANLVSLTLASGQAQVVNFGDRSNLPIGTIKGTVFADPDKDGVQGAGEPGIQGVLVSLDNGAQTYTNSTGYYSFVAKQGNYVVVEVDPVGYSSTTPNSGSASIVSEGDSVTINFGDFAGPVSGVLEGYVFLDINEDGMRNSLEEGLPNVRIKISSGDSTLTNASGYYSFSITPAVYSVTETDPEGYVSTTVNAYLDITITADTTVTRNFGDVLEDRQDFVEIHISNTDRVLSVCTANLKEDDKSDEDIVLGTALLTEIGNMLVFHNEWETSATPITELFNSDPVYRRDAGRNINTMSKYDFNNDLVPDVLTGLDIVAERNVQLWFTGSDGILSTTPDESFFTSGMNEVMDSKLADFDIDGDIDILVGLKSPLGTTGAWEILKGDGTGSFNSSRFQSTAGAGDEFVLGAVWAVEAGDIDGDGDQDIIVGSHVTPYVGYIDVYENIGFSSANFAWHSRYNTRGAVNDIKAVDMMEDDGGDPDIVAATTIADNSGMVLLWLNTAGTFGIPDTTGFTFGPQEIHNMPDDFVDAGGEALSLDVIRVNNDVYPDICFGTRSSSLYAGDIYILPAYGTLPENGTKINTSDLGEIISIAVADFNKDSRPDIVVGTRSSVTQGRLVAFFGK